MSLLSFITVSFAMIVYGKKVFLAQCVSCDLQYQLWPLHHMNAHPYLVKWLMDCEKAPGTIMEISAGLYGSIADKV